MEQNGTSSRPFLFFKTAGFKTLTHSSVFKYSVLYGLDCHSDSSAFYFDFWEKRHKANSLERNKHDRNSDLVGMGRPHSQPTLGGSARSN